MSYQDNADAAFQGGSTLRLTITHANHVIDIV